MMRFLFRHHRYQLRRLRPNVGIISVTAVIIFPVGVVVAAADNFLTDGTVAPSLVQPADLFQDCDRFFGITKPDDCLAACGGFLINFNLYTVDWVTQDDESVDDDIIDQNARDFVLSSSTPVESIGVEEFDTTTEADGLRKLYAGFICQCPSQRPSINCVYKYDFPSCRKVGVVDCSDTDLSVSNTKDPPPPPTSVTLAPAFAPNPPSLPPQDLSPVFNATINKPWNETNMTFTNTTEERFRYLWRKMRRRDLQGPDGESDIFLDEMFNSTEESPGTGFDPGSGSSSGERDNVTMISSEDNVINTDVNTTADNNIASTQNITTGSTTTSNLTTDSTTSNNSTSSDTSSVATASCASFCLSLGMDVGANGEGQTSKNNINSKATRTICAANPGRSVDGGDKEEEDDDDVTTTTGTVTTRNSVPPWVACACQVRSVFSNDGSNRVYVTEGFYVCGDEGFNKTGVVLGSSGSFGSDRSRREAMVGGIGLIGLLLIHTTFAVLSCQL